MARLIDADALVRRLDATLNHAQKCPGRTEWKHGKEAGLDQAITAVRAASTIDAVEVVRCKDCKDARKEKALDNREYFMCKHTETYHSGSHFCSYGERRSDNAAD